MKRTKGFLTAIALLLSLMLQAAAPPPALASDRSAGSTCIELIKRFEGYSAEAYEENGKWYIGYGTQIKQGAYPDGVTEAEAEALLRGELHAAEGLLNRALTRYGITLSQGQFDALVDFTYTLGGSWLNGTSDLLCIVRGELQASRRETARAFGVWSHAGGKVLPGLAERRLAEAALYLDGDLSRADEFCWLTVEKEDGVVYATDFGVYERGGTYDAFPAMFRLGYTPAAVQTAEGLLIRPGDAVTENRSGAVVWEKNAYAGRSYEDVPGDSWFYDYVMELSEAGVINGRSDGTYAPDLAVTTGEALKLILLAAGHAEQAAADGHWAGGYAAYAAERSYLSPAALANLDAPITRRNVARLAALALGFGQSFAASPFVDADDGFVTALAEIGVLEGSVEDGQTVYRPEASLTRSEVSAVVWRLRRAVALGQRQTVAIGSQQRRAVPGVPRSTYDKNAFSGSGTSMTYEEPGVTVLRGVDVSSYQESVDWQAVAADGIDFAILRVGGRYQQSGQLYDDRLFESHYAGASEAGLTIGVYFYSQAISVDEALEEADFVLARLEGKTIDGPVVFDWETAGSAARTDGLPASVLCDCAVAFCERVREAGCSPMIYMNAYDGYIRYDLSRLSGYPIWYAGQYNGAYPKFLYDFAIWQYTDKGAVNGISHSADMDLWFLR